ncbi:MAG TPA: hypothetical protein VNE00_08940 [Paraburkholderia sp.]|jgi:predicted ArsR family transcriptional regulator|nr:hypothetical protein [Paraburkholderia sp.]
MKTLPAQAVRPELGFFAKLRALANEALQLHLQHCAVLAESFRRD